MDLEATNYPVQLHINYFSEVGPKRKINQDNYFIGSYSNLFSKSFIADSDKIDTQDITAIALFDGMGGESSGERASLVAAETMKEFISYLGDTLYRQTIIGASKLYYSNFMEIISDYLGDDTSVCGTTFVGAFLQNQLLIPVWLGDSRAYLLRNRTLYRLTTDHSLAQIKIEQGLISEEEAKTTHDWHVLTGYMGQFDGELSVGEPVKLQSGDKIFLCSDGITDKYTDEVLQEILYKSSKSAIKVMLDMAQNEADDNCTAILVDVKANPLYGSLKILSRRASEWQHSFKSKIRK